MIDNSVLDLPSLPIALMPGFGQEEMDNLLWSAARLGASDISIQTEDYIYFMIAGEQTRATSRILQEYEMDFVLTSLYGMNGVSKISQGDSIDKRYEIRPVRGERIGFRVNIVPARVDGNEKSAAITFRVLPKNPPHINDLKAPKDIVENALPRNGLVVIAGVTSSGKSTLIASILRMGIENATEKRKIASYEDPIEYVYDGIKTISPKISQTEIGGEKNGLKTWGEAVKTAMRRALSIILIGECRDGETLNGCISMALSGHCTLTSVHADRVSVAFRRMVAMAAEEGGGYGAVTEKLLGSTKLIVIQALCPKIGGGRVALREWLVISRTIQDRLFKLRPDEVSVALQDEVDAAGTSMGHSAFKAYRDGFITLERACEYSGLSEHELTSLVINDSKFCEYKL